MRILYAGYRDRNHSKFAGYDYIARYPGASYLDAGTLPLGCIPVGRCGKRLNLMVLDYFARQERDNFDIIHYFYGDSCLFRQKPRKSRARFVSTIHLKAEALPARRVGILRSYDGVVALSKAEAARLRDLDIRASFIPHGFPTPQFTGRIYDGFDIDAVNIFYSGMNYRDFETFYRMAGYCLGKKLPVRFYAVGQSLENRERLMKLGNVVVCPWLDDDAYYSLLSQCDYNFLPLTFATANNALLEAQALGVVSIIPEISGITDYAERNWNLFYSSFDEATSIFDGLSKSAPDGRLIAFSRSFLWENVYPQLGIFYEDLLGT